MFAIMVHIAPHVTDLGFSLNIGANVIAIISGVGAREYFRSEWGYELDGAYMVKELSAPSVKKRVASL